VQDGVAFAALEDVRLWKEAAGRPKDMADLELIRNYQARLSSTSTVQSQVETALGEYGIRHEVLACDPSLADTAAFCEHYGFTLGQAANTILVASRKVEPTKYVLCVVLGTTRLDVNKKVCELLSVKRASFADAETTRALTGMEIGGVVAIGTDTGIPVYIDSQVLEQEKVVMGGGNRTSKLVLNPQELLKLPHAQVVENLAKATAA
jgi:prolyl-tRNA editing enzyme YbaK/EbsC (Cys-tRNA(Pro) deacylase)